MLEASLFRSEAGSENYRFLRDDRSDIATTYRRKIDEWWEHYQQLLDPDFDLKFPHAPVQRYWELAVADIIDRRTSLELRWNRVTGETPDFITTYNDREIWIEATTVGRGEAGRPDSVPPRVYGDEGYVCGAERRVLGLRLQNSLYTKATKLFELNGDGISIVAIGGGDVPTSQWHDNLIDWSWVASYFYPFAPQRRVRLDGGTVAHESEAGFYKLGAGEAIPKGLAQRALPLAAGELPPAKRQVLNTHIAGVLFSPHTIASLSYRIDPEVYWIENPFCAEATALRPALTSLNRIVVQLHPRRIEYLPANNLSLS